MTSPLFQTHHTACLHCRKFADDWEVLAKALKGKITLGKVNVGTGVFCMTVVRI